MQLRTSSDQNYIDIISAMGAHPVTMAFSETYNAIQCGVVNGTEGDVFSGYDSRGIHEVAPYCNLTNHMMPLMLLVVNNDFLASLSEQGRAIFLEACTNSQQTCFEAYPIWLEIAQDRLEPMGVTFSECDVAAFQKLCQPLIDEKASYSDLTYNTYQAILSVR